MWIANKLAWSFNCQLKSYRVESSQFWWAKNFQELFRRKIHVDAVGCLRKCSSVIDQELLARRFRKKVSTYFNFFMGRGGGLEVEMKSYWLLIFLRKDENQQKKRSGLPHLKKLFISKYSTRTVLTPAISRREYWKTRWSSGSRFTERSWSWSRSPATSSSTTTSIRTTSTLPPSSSTRRWYESGTRSTLSVSPASLPAGSWRSGTSSLSESLPSCSRMTLCTRCQHFVKFMPTI